MPWDPLRRRGGRPAVPELLRRQRRALALQSAWSSAGDLGGCLGIVVCGLVPAALAPGWAAIRRAAANHLATWPNKANPDRRLDAVGAPELKIAAASRLLTRRPDFRAISRHLPVPCRAPPLAVYPPASPLGTFPHPGPAAVIQLASYTALPGRRLS